jgi:ubiquinone/menaquinone biosynthesis C-methylase UbiE
VGLWDHIFAACYDRFQARMERRFLGAVRREVLAGARGRVVEIGAGTGANLPHYPAGLDELVLTEPYELMARQIEPKLAEHGRSARVVLAPAESLPLEDGSFDTAVSTLTLCTVDDPGAALRELRRVLRPGGRLLFLEHVRSPDPKLARWQDRLHRPWHWFGNGCHCNRPTLETIAAGPFEVERHRRGEIPQAPPIVKPLVTGSAVAR